MNRKHLSISIFFFLFALSGFSGLIYESIWTHYLKLFLGHAAYAQTLVLAIFMGGMAIGSWVCSAYSLRWKNLFLGYAIAEGIIGIIALLFHSVFIAFLDVSYDIIIPQLGGPLLVDTFKWILSAMLILPQSVLLGMTFPLMTSGVVRRYPQNPGRSLAMLYFTNSIGAAIGVLASGFLFINLFGLPGTIRLAGLINIVLALVVWIIVGRSAQEKELAAPKAENVPEPSRVSLYSFFLLMSLVTGASSFIYEVGWIRMLSLVLGASSHSFELMLSAFILGLAFGSLWIQRRIDTLKFPMHFLGYVQIIMGVFALMTLILYGTTFDVMQWLVKNIDKTDAGYSLFNLSRSAIAMAIMIPATFCAGMTLPLITLILMKQKRGERSIGAVYAANTIGAIIGVFFAIHIGMPGLGLKGLITFGAGLDIALGMAFFWYGKDKLISRRQAIVSMTAVAGILGVVFFVHLNPYKMGSGVYREGTLSTPASDRILYHRDGKTATVSCFLNFDGILSIRTNGKPDAAVMVRPGKEHVSDEATMILLAVMPMIYHPQAQTAGVIGIGSGYTSSMLLANPNVKEVDTIEIEKNMVEAAHNFQPFVDSVLNDRRSKIYFDDAKTFFSRYNKQYDIIVSEPSNPWVSGVAGLFSSEFYHRAKMHLRDDGLFVQWVQLYEFNTDLIISILKAFSENFADYAVFTTVDADMMIIATKKDALPLPDYSSLNIPAIATALHSIHIYNEQDIAIRKKGTKRFFEKLLKASPVPANSDYYPYLDQNAERIRFLDAQVNDFLYFNFPVPALEMLQPSTPRIEATDISPSPYYGTSQDFYIAMNLRDYFSFGVADFRYLTRELMQPLLHFKKYCGRSTALGEKERLNTMFILSATMLPYLNPFERDKFWKTLESGKCLKAPSPLETDWLTLFRAISRRGSSEMLAASRKLLEKQQGLSSIEKRYLLAAGMIGAVAQEKRPEAYRLWSRYGTGIFGNSEPDLLFRILIAEASHR